MVQKIPEKSLDTSAPPAILAHSHEMADRFVLAGHTHEFIAEEIARDELGPFYSHILFEVEGICE